MHFSTDEKIAFLRKHGYVVEKKVVRMGYPCYHNDIEYEDVEVWAVSRDGAEAHKPGGYNFTATAWVDAAFNYAMKEAMLRL